MRKIALAFAAASFSGLGGTDATAAPAFWQGAWGHPPTAINDTPPVTRPDGGVARPVYAPLSAYKDTTVRQVVRIGSAARMLRLRLTNEFGVKGEKSTGRR